MNYSEKFITELNAAVAAELAPYEGTTMRYPELEKLTENLNAACRIVYAQHSVPYPGNFDVDATIKLIKVLSFVSNLTDELEGVAEANIAHDERLLDSVDRYDPGESVEDDMPDEARGEMPHNWAELVGSMDANLWTNSFLEVIDENPMLLDDRSTIYGWFANAIMAGYDNAMWQEYPTQELTDNEYVYVEFYNILTPDQSYDPGEKVVVATFKFPTLNAAQSFVTHNGGEVDASFYRMYTMEETTTYVQRDLT